MRTRLLVHGCKNIARILPQDRVEGNKRLQQGRPFCLIQPSQTMNRRRERRPLNRRHLTCGKCLVCAIKNELKLCKPQRLRQKQHFLQKKRMMPLNLPHIHLERLRRPYTTGCRKIPHRKMNHLRHLITRRHPNPGQLAKLRRNILLGRNRKLEHLRTFKQLELRSELIRRRNPTTRSEPFGQPNTQLRPAPYKVVTNRSGSHGLPASHQLIGMNAQLCFSHRRALRQTTRRETPAPVP